MMQALVLLTFATSLDAYHTMQHHSSHQECACCAAIPNTDYAVFTTGAQMLSEYPRPALLYLGPPQ